MAGNFTQVVDGSQYGTTDRVVRNSNQSEIKTEQDDVVSIMLDDVASTSVGQLGGVGVLSEDTMKVANGLASGKMKTSGELSEGILGDTGQVLANKMVKSYGNVLNPKPRAGVSASASISVTVDTSEIAAAASQAASGAMETVCSAMDKGIAKIQSLTSIVGKFNGATKLLTASIQKALDMQIAKMMAKIMAMVNTAHGITHPLFLAIFPMTWSENRQWSPGWGEAPAAWMECVKELVEYFDFVQKVFGGAINEVCKCCDKLFTQVVNAAGGLQVSLSAQVSVSFPMPPLAVPLMSISKQVEDLLKKVQIIKEIIRQKARQILAKLKNLAAPELFINVPSDFFTILEVLVEAEFIYANLPIVMDKILEFFINLFVKKFSEIASAIIDKIFAIWKKVVEIVPPLQDLVEMCWAIPNTADCCFNCALNIALPEMWGIVQPFVMMPFECIDMISEACDAATELAYAIPEP